MLIINGQLVRPDGTHHLADPSANENTDGVKPGRGLAFDDGFAFGRGAFETLPVYSRPMWLAQHLERLNRTLKQLNIQRRVEEQEIIELIKREAIRHEALKIIATAENLVLTTRPLPNLAKNGVSLLINPDGHPAVPPLAGLKTLNYLGYLLAREHAMEAGFSDALLLSPTRHVLETASANIFILEGNLIRTPPADGTILPGIVRQHILSQFEVEESPITIDELRSADAVFVTNSLIGIRFVQQIGNQQLRQTSSSPLLTAIMNDFAKAAGLAANENLL